ncbi:L-threonylcarbamoyladenylate synthase [Alkaliphilus peptidifermentans]|uniref:Threonylcarbamoyl-AMP synthase n=1 Tax=Alkaliphilus peptidifermentans DSM 18978 TaxID=1120976 RepID=A0A1G5LAL0_9FIRM|nr:L-threonylcarbamoyladenylate synthase [Alkaliphilus peptidifermentans]SCZ09300.1 translation factor SUA5 [Alkaliphilus peptidifermentans DSM 18978]
MKDTKIIDIDCNNIDEEKISFCGSILNRGGTVAFPTETVYGLGANALDEKAVKKIYEAKGRPSDNPLIIHISNIKDIEPLVWEIPEAANRAMKSFWPGPLTLIFKKSKIVPDIITAGLDTVAIRYPRHPIAEMLIKKAKVPIAAPSANLSGKPSPTKGSHVIQDLMGRVDAIVVGEDCNVGLESTVLDLTVDIPTILRPGGITKEMLEEIFDRVEVDPALKDQSILTPKSPGMKYTHYAPKADIVIYEGEESRVVNRIGEKVDELIANGKSVGIICTNETRNFYSVGLIKSVGSRKDMKTIASRLFGILRDFDDTDVDIILAEAIEEVELGQAIMNRLSKASGYRIKKV